MAIVVNLRDRLFSQEYGGCTGMPYSSKLQIRCAHHAPAAGRIFRLACLWAMQTKLPTPSMIQGGITHSRHSHAVGDLLQSSWSAPCRSCEYAQRNNCGMASPATSSAAASDRDQPILEGQGANPEAGSKEAATEGAGSRSGSSSSDVEKQQRKETRQLWFDAIKLPLYSVAINPIVVSAGAAYLTTGGFAASCFWYLVGGAILVIAWLNTSNDAYDAATGVDKTKEESIVNLTGGNAAPVLAIATACLAAGAYLLWRGIASADDPRVSWALAAAIFMGYLYQGPPFRLSYLTLGEPLCFLAFGPLATSAFYLAQVAAAGATAASVSAAATVGAVVVGHTTSIILLCSHFHQIKGDLAAGKMSPLVRLGPRRAMQVLRGCVYGIYLVVTGAAAAGWLPWACIPAQLGSVPTAKALLEFAERTHMDSEAVFPLKRYAVKWHIAWGASLTAGLVLGRMALPV